MRFVVASLFVSGVYRAAQANTFNTWATVIIIIVACGLLWALQFSLLCAEWKRFAASISNSVEKEPETNKKTLLSTV